MSVINHIPLHEDAVKHHRYRTYFQTPEGELIEVFSNRTDVKMWVKMAARPHTNLTEIPLGKVTDVQKEALAAQIHVGNRKSFGCRYHAKTFNPLKYFPSEYARTYKGYCYSYSCYLYFNDGAILHLLSHTEFLTLWTEKNLRDGIKRPAIMEKYPGNAAPDLAAELEITPSGNAIVWESVDTFKYEDYFKDMEKEKEEPKEFFATIGYGQLEGVQTGFVIITAPNEAEAREAISKLTANRYAFMYYSLEEINPIDQNFICHIEAVTAGNSTVPRLIKASSEKLMKNFLGYENLI